MKRKVDIVLIERVVDVFIKGIKTAVFFLAFLPNLYSVEITLDDAVKIAFERNISIQNALTSYEIYLEKINEYYGSAYPQINLTASYTKNFQKPLGFMGGRKMEVGLSNSYSAGISLNQVVWSGGRVGTAIELAKDFASSSQENVALTKNLVKKTVKQIFYSVLYSKEVINLKDEILKIELEHLKINKEKYSKGLVSDLAVVRSELEVANREVDLVRARNLYDVGILTLKELLGVDISESVEIKGSFDIEIKSFDIDEIYSKALLNRPEYKLAVLRKQIAEKQLKIEKGNYLPVVSLFLNRQFSGQNEKNSFPPPQLRGWSLIGGVNLNLSLFNGFSTSARIKQIEYEIIEKERDIEDIKRKMRVEIEKVMLELEEVKKRIQTQMLSIKNAQRILKGTEERYIAGISSQMELNEATVLYSSAKLTYLTAIFDYLTILSNLEYLCGGEL